MIDWKIQIMSGVIGVALAGSIVAFAAVSATKAQTATSSAAVPQSSSIEGILSNSVGSANLISSKIVSESNTSSSNEVKKMESESIQTTAAESTKTQAKNNGWTESEKTLSNGIKVIITTVSGVSASQKPLGPPSRAASSTLPALSAVSNTASK